MVTARKSAKAASKVASTETVDVQNVNHPGKTEKRNRAKYEAVRKAFLKVMPKSGPGVTQAEMVALMKQALPASEWGTTQGWWTKTVQLDAEARGEVTRDGGKPLRWKRVK
jgi:hypothetical protein